MSECPEIKMIPRFEWSRRNVTGTLDNLQMSSNMVYSHTFTDGCNSRDTCAKIVRAIQNVHMDRNMFSDIAYNFLIGGDGSIFEGRDYTRKGAFSTAYNLKSLGTAFIGTFETEEQILNNFTFAAAKSAYGLCQCVEKNIYSRDCSNATVVLLYVNPAMKKYILDPESQPLLTRMTTTARTTASSSLSSTSSFTTNAVTVSTAFSTPASTPPKGPTPSDLTSEGIAGIVVGVVGLLLLTMYLVWFFGKRRTRNKQKTKDYRAAIQKLASPYIVAYYERPRWTVDLKNTCLGMGQYGQVFKGTLAGNKRQKLTHSTLAGPRPVAIKMLRDPGCGYEETADFLAEMSIHMRVGRHVNIVNLEGVVLQGRLMMVMEHCQFGSLDTYMRTIKANSEKCAALEIDTEVAELICFSHQISRGMEYLSSKGIIHRDLAARNILLTSEKTAKIADFGMARQQPEYILERDKILVPVCWMAPESIIPGRGVFTTQSDIWSFGVVLWEIFSFGDIPYAAEFPNGILYSQFCNFIQEGHRLQVPELCPDCVALLITKYWNFVPEGRPDFVNLKENLECLLPATERARYVICDAENETLNSTLVNFVDKLDCEAG